MDTEDLGMIILAFPCAGLLPPGAARSARCAAYPSARGLQAPVCFLESLPTMWMLSGPRPRLAYTDMSLLEPYPAGMAKCRNVKTLTLQSIKWIQTFTYRILLL